MGTRNDMLRKYLTVVGFGSIIFGLVFFVMTMIATFRMMEVSEAYAKLSATGWERTATILQSAQHYGFQMFQALTLGGICLYLANKMRDAS